MDLPTPRPYHDDDHRGVLALIGGVYAEYGFELDLDDIDAHLTAPGRTFRSGGGEFWVVEADGELVATVAAKVAGAHVELKSLYVRADHRRQGWGAALSRWVESFARTEGIHHITLWSDTRFLDAHRLYERLGYLRGGVRHFNDVNQTSEFEFSKDLVGPGSDAGA